MNTLQITIYIQTITTALNSSYNVYLSGNTKELTHTF